MKLDKFEIGKAFQCDADEIVKAREKAIIIHHTKDINAAGDEVELVVRNIVKRKLPTSFYTGHGHIVDSQLNVSEQIDIIIADNLGSQVLLKTANETEYFIFESVYAIGEIKSSYYKSKDYINKFVEVVSGLKYKNKLIREKVLPNYIGNGLSLGAGLGMTRTPSRPYINPLFSFMLFVDSGDFEIADIQEIYRTRKPIELPNMICFLDKGLIVNFKNKNEKGTQDNYKEIDIFPEYNDNKVPNEWHFLNEISNENILGANFAFLYYSLISHLKSCVLKTNDINPYLRGIFHSHLIEKKHFQKIV